MKRHKQLPGIRRWAGDDLIELQNEPLKAIDAIFADYPLCVISGCEVTTNEGGSYTITPGYVTLRNPDEQQGRLMVVPFEGITVDVMPIHLVLSNIPQDRVYGDGAIKPVCDNYFAYPTVVVPDMPYLTISETNTTRFVDLVQSKAMAAKVDKVAGKALSSNDYTHLEKSKLAGVEEGATNFTHPAGFHVTQTEKNSWSAKVTPIDHTELFTEQIIEGEFWPGITKSKSQVAVQTFAGRVEEPHVLLRGKNIVASVISGHTIYNSGAPQMLNERNIEITNFDRQTGMYDVCLCGCTIGGSYYITLKYTF